MLLTGNQTDKSSLVAIGDEAVALLQAGHISQLADRFGYAISFDQEPSDAIRRDLASCLSKIGASGLSQSPARSDVAVSYFNSNESGLFALIECRVPTDNGTKFLVELIVTNSGTDTHVTLEQISDAA